MMGKTIARGFLVVAGVLALINFAAVWFALERVTKVLGVAAPTALAESTLRGDLGALFGMFGVMAILAGVRDDRRLLLAPILLPALAVAGRLLTYVQSPTPTALPLIAVEAVVLVGVLLARTRIG